MNALTHHAMWPERSLRATTRDWLNKPLCQVSGSCPAGLDLDGHLSGTQRPNGNDGYLNQSSWNIF